jgi:hypothetical protein
MLLAGKMIQMFFSFLFSSHTELRSAHLCICVIMLVNVAALTFGFLSLGFYLHFAPSLGSDSVSACFGHHCFLIAVFDAISSLTHSGLTIQPAGYSTFVEQ